MAENQNEVQEDYIVAGKINFNDLEPLDETTANLMKGELRVSNILAFIYGAFIISVPVLNWYVPKIAFAKVWGGMTYTWFASTILAMFLAVIIAAVHMYLYSKRMVKSVE